MDAPTEVSRLPLTSADPLAERLAQLRALFPEAVGEGKCDLEKLRALLGEGAARGDERERYGLSWAGKSDALKALRTRTTATLLPAPGESVNWDNTGHAIIEGDNLEVLKVLQTAYYGQVKLIYIDPPYNTGGDFIYPDDYAEGLGSYLTYLGQVKDGVKQTTNLDTSGRYHSRWLTMIYPRLFLARNLLREDGVIFVSIDDHEVSNLRMVMDEVFGEENFIGQISWRNVTDNNPTLVTKDNEFVLVYARAIEAQPQVWKSKVSEAKDTLHREYERLRDEYKQPLEVERRLRGFISDNAEVLATLTRYKNVDEQGVFTGSESVHNPRAGGYDFEVLHPVTKLPMRKPATGYRFPEATFREMEASGRILYGEDENRIVKIKKYLTEFEDTLRSVITLDGRLGSYDIKRLFGSEETPFNNPKPVLLLKSFLSFAGGKDDLILDFFAGSGTTAQAVLELNREDGGNRRFVLVQLPEPTGREDFPTIAEITKERVRRVIRKMKAEMAAKERKEHKEGTEELPLEPAESLRSLRSFAANPDLGFKVFKLAESNFAIWNPALAATDPEALAKQWQLTADNVRADASETALLYELMLKASPKDWLPLQMPPTAVDVAGVRAWMLGGDRLLLCLARELTREPLRAMIALKPQAVLCLDTAFQGNDALKVNADLEFQSHGIKFATA